MTNNDILRRLRYALQLNDAQLVKVIAHTEKKVTTGEVASWLKPENDPDLVVSGPMAKFRSHVSRFLIMRC